MAESGWHLTTTETQRLAELEQSITAGLQTFVEVGNALAEIRDARLYRQTHGTFEDYCRERWGMTRRRAYQMIDAAAVVENVKNFSHPPQVESHTAALTPLSPELQRDAWREAVETAPNGKVTAAHVESVVQQYVKPAPAKVAPRYVPVDDGWQSEDDEAPHAPDKLAVHFSSETPEHYTPEVIIRAAMLCMGDIDLDPCSNSKDAPNVPAVRHFTKDDDGLAQKWSGRVYMNPPYGREIGKWVDKLCDEHETGEVDYAIALLPARTDTQWWKRLRDYPVCFIEGRLTFVGNDDPAPFPSAVFYLGDDIASFWYAFDVLGDIYQRVIREMFGE